MNNLYEITGDIKDINTLLINRDKLIHVGWRVFDGEGGYYFVQYEDNEDYETRWHSTNGPKYKNWIERVYIMEF